MENNKEIYTGIIRVWDKITRNDKKIKIIIISDVKTFGSNNDKYTLIRTRNIKEFRVLNPGDVVKFDARVSKDHKGKIIKSGIFDIEELNKFPHLVNVTNVSHLKHETDNKKIKTCYCRQCGALIHIKQKNKLCDKCRAPIERARKCRETRAKNKKQNSINRKTKKCRICGGTYLKVTHFINNKRSKDGYSNICIYCKGNV